MTKFKIFAAISWTSAIIVVVWLMCLFAINFEPEHKVSQTRLSNNYNSTKNPVDDNFYNISPRPTKGPTSIPPTRTPTVTPIPPTPTLSQQIIEANTFVYINKAKGIKLRYPKSTKQYGYCTNLPKLQQSEEEKIGVFPNANDSEIYIGPIFVIYGKDKEHCIKEQNSFELQEKLKESNEFIWYSNQTMKFYLWSINDEGDLQKMISGLSSSLYVDHLVMKDLYTYSVKISNNPYNEFMLQPYIYSYSSKNRSAYFAFIGQNSPWPESVISNVKAEFIH